MALDEGMTCLVNIPVSLESNKSMVLVLARHEYQYDLQSKVIQLDQGIRYDWSIWYHA